MALYDTLSSFDVQGLGPRPDVNPHFTVRITHQKTLVISVPLDGQDILSFVETYLVVNDDGVDDDADETDKKDIRRFYLAEMEDQYGNELDHELWGTNGHDPDGVQMVANKIKEYIDEILNQ